LASIVSFYYGTDDSALVALFTELVLLPPVAEMLVVLPFSSLPVMIEVRLPSILSRTLAIKVSYISAELLSRLFTALQTLTSSALAWLNNPLRVALSPPYLLPALL
jgi:hypothetical protein